MSPGQLPRSVSHWWDVVRTVQGCERFLDWQSLSSITEPKGFIVVVTGAAREASASAARAITSRTHTATAKLDLDIFMFPSL